MSVDNEWSAGFETVGGAKDIQLYISPFSDNASDNAKAGHITGGVLTQEYEPSKKLQKAAEASYMYTDRTDISKYNELAMNLQGVVDVPKEEVKKEGFRKHKKVEQQVEQFGIPGLVDSHFVNTSLPATQIGDYSGLDAVDATVDSTIADAKEAFTAEQTRTVLIIVAVVVALCVVGFCFGFLIPKIRMNHKVKVVGDRKTAF